MKTPTSAILWECWARQKTLFAMQGAGLLIGIGCVVGRYSTASSEWQAFYTAFPNIFCFLGLLQTITCFCYTEIDTRRAQSGMPGYLLLKPVSTLRLVAVPMIGGGIAIVVILLAWTGLVLRYLDFPTRYIPWFCGVLLALTWSVQAVGWAIAGLRWAWQTVLMLIAIGVNVLLGSAPFISKEIHYGYLLGMLGALLTGTFGLAIIGIRRIRHGEWEKGPSPGRRISHSRNHKARRFRSALEAQFWLEWRRMGLTLPTLTAIGMLLTFLADFGLRFGFGRSVGVAMPADVDDVAQVLQAILLIPFGCSFMLGNGVATFDQSLPANEMPTFIAIRPMTNGGFVISKLAMAAATSALTWLLVVVGTLGWLSVQSNSEPARKIWEFASGLGPQAVIVAGAAWFLLLTVLTWRNLVAGIWVGLAGRGTFTGTFTVMKSLACLALGLMIVKAKIDEPFRATLFWWLPWVLGTGLILKFLSSFFAFRWSLQRKAVTPGIVGSIILGWLACQWYIAILAVLACLGTPMPNAWIWIVLGAFYVIPLAGMAFAPLALTWNRHR